MVNTQMLTGRWNQVRGQVKRKWGQLTDDDLRLHDGNIDQLVGKIQQKTGETREVIENFLEDLTSHGAAAISHAAESARQYAGQAADQVREGYGRLSDEFGRQFEMSRDMVRENPARSVATAFGVGVVLGVVIGLALRSH
jgi:uncharacterized protein YjbJ (UPF0337 family)